MYIDTHAHVNDDKLYQQRQEVLQRALAAGVTNIINVGYDMNSSLRAVELTKEDQTYAAAVGCHPHDAVDFSETFAADIYDLAQDEGVVAYGEIGLDYYYDNSPREIQRKAFVAQIALANELSLPVIIHNRDSHGDMLEILQKNPLSAGGVMHCFSGSKEFAQECVRLGLYVSFAGPVTFKNAPKLQRAVTGVPLDRLLVETDCPYLSPEPRRGRINEPANVRYVAWKVAELKELPVEEMASILADNAQRLFNLSKQQ